MYGRQPLQLHWEHSDQCYATGDGNAPARLSKANDLDIQEHIGISSEYYFFGGGGTRIRILLQHDQ